MSEDLKILDEVTQQDYKWGFVSNFESDFAPKGLNDDIIRFISEKKNEPEWMLEWRLKAFRYWVSIEDKEPTWANISYPKIDYQNIKYYSAPKQKVAPKSLDEIDPELRKTFDKL